MFAEVQTWVLCKVLSALDPEHPCVPCLLLEIGFHSFQAQAILKLHIYVPQPPEFWDFRNVPQLLALRYNFLVLFFESLLRPRLGVSLLCFPS